MITQLVDSFQYPVQKCGGTYMGRKLEPMLFATYYKGNITTGKTASESINKMLCYSMKNKKI